MGALRRIRLLILNIKLVIQKLASHLLNFVKKNARKTRNVNIGAIMVIVIIVSLFQDNGLLTYAVSAKTGEGVNLCMQKISADLLGIRLSKQEQEQQQTVVR